jgi:hypothetical protein
MTSDHELEVMLDALESAGLAEVYLDEDGRETMRLTDEGAALAQEMGIFEHGFGADEMGQPTSGEGAEPSAPLDLRNSWGTAVGSAMLGFEQALRSEPPPHILAAEHIPERGTSGDDTGLVIEFPDPLERRVR